MPEKQLIMTHAYNEIYLQDAMRNIGIMTHFCINEYKLSPNAFYEAFLKSNISSQIAKGNPRYLVGHSGKELADLVLSDIDHCPAATDIYSVTPEYWAGWALAYYQWYTAQDFSEICSGELTFERVLRMYNPLHEADLSKFVEVVASNDLKKTER